MVRSHSFGTPTEHFLTPAEYADSVFHQSSLRAGYSSGASAYDSVRPRFDSSGFFPYDVFPPISHRVVLRTSRLAFRTNFLGFRPEVVDSLSVYMALVRDRKAVSNIVQVDMRQVHPDTWRPLTFHEFDWIVDASEEVSFYAEVVARVRIPSQSKPFGIKDTLIGHDGMRFVRFRDGSLQPAVTGKVELTLRRPEEIPAGHETSLAFHMSHPQDRHLGLHDDFVCPTEAVPAFQQLKEHLVQLFSPFACPFHKWSLSYLPLIMFKEIANNDRALRCLLDSFSVKSPSLIVAKIPKFYACTNVLARTGLYVIPASSETVERATDRVGTALQQGKMAPDERIKPFHTDELRHPLILGLADFYD
jgi:hypothetical protein